MPPFKTAPELTSTKEIHYQEYRCGEGRKEDEEKKEKKGSSVSMPHVICSIGPGYKQPVLLSQSSF